MPSGTGPPGGNGTNSDITTNDPPARVPFSFLSHKTVGSPSTSGASASGRCRGALGGVATKASTETATPQTGPRTARYQGGAMRIGKRPRFYMFYLMFASRLC